MENVKSGKFLAREMKILTLFFKKSKNELLNFSYLPNIYAFANDVLVINNHLTLNAVKLSVIETKFTSEKNNDDQKLDEEFEIKTQICDKKDNFCEVKVLPKTEPKFNRGNNKITNNKIADFKLNEFEKQKVVLPILENNIKSLDLKTNDKFEMVGICSLKSQTKINAEKINKRTHQCGQST